MMKQLISDFLHLIYPNVCLVCHKNLLAKEQFICFSCLSQLSYTSYHLQKDNPIEKLFWGKVPIERATSLFFFQKEAPSQLLLHHLKYKGDKEIGELLGRMLGEALKSVPDFDVDIIVPVPLHPKKLQKRGYNQSEWIAKGIAALLQKPVDTGHLIRVIDNPTQTQKGVYERWTNASGIFALSDPGVFEGKHLLLVDDVITTGATIEACSHALMESSGVRISVASLASV
jgi:ComF family protein